MDPETLVNANCALRFFLLQKNARTPTPISTTIPPITIPTINAINAGVCNPLGGRPGPGGAGACSVPFAAGGGELVPSVVTDEEGEGDDDICKGKRLPAPSPERSAHDTSGELRHCRDLAPAAVFSAISETKPLILRSKETATTSFEMYKVTSFHSLLPTGRTDSMEKEGEVAAAASESTASENEKKRPFPRIQSFIAIWHPSSLVLLLSFLFFYVSIP